MKKILLPILMTAALAATTAAQAQLVDIGWSWTSLDGGPNGYGVIEAYDDGIDTSSYPPYAPHVYDAVEISGEFGGGGFGNLPVGGILDDFTADPTSDYPFTGSVENFDDFDGFDFSLSNNEYYSTSGDAYYIFFNPNTDSNRLVIDDGNGIFALTVVPEPTSLALGALGLGSLVAFRRRAVK